MPARAYWQGQIRLALVSIPVEVYPATRSGAAISFHQIHEPSGKRIRYEKVAPGVGPVDRDEIIRGYEVSKDEYVLLDDEEIAAAQVESRKTLELVQFVEPSEIDVLFYEKPYFVVPADDLAEEAYGVLRDALRQTRRVGLGQLSVRGREQLVSLKPCGRGLVLEVLRYADEVHRAQGYFKDIPETEPSEDLIALATTLIEKKTAPFKPAEFHDRYVDALHRLIEKKRKSGTGKRILEDAEDDSGGKGGNVIDLMAALKKSVGEDKPARKPAKNPARKPATRRKKA
ncbi:MULTISPECIES: Ku protein [unclassified Novosphingobium]|uniref:non-homologous end joining protein Ku n=1 Tax=unclassified Novosphingobium TaxID=2644732 RepID=UPI000D31196F|nr:MULTISPECIES: Ku protein [unclassified Novosphingobium]PTR06685.1 DNA end-binding protein Ku [Novosphingobium sp. GV055]PUA94978.1 DNA end-binding protein Ku [Novosphingobium sp. GV061]PUB14106.1 DNA end-binding protein Ku [Novosphingobium sp. GV079]PUB38680.1 DNA end-binding protein Ku [Novosphingobium sp. GV027]